MADIAEFLGTKPQLSRMVDSLYDAIIDSKEPDHVRYCEAILVLNYMHSEYRKMEDSNMENNKIENVGQEGPEDSHLPEEFLSEQDFPQLFVGSADYMKKEKGLRPEKVRDIYNNCVLIYQNLRQVAEAHSIPVSQKIIDIESVTGVLRTQCIEDGKDPFRLIKKRDKYQP